MKYIIILTTIFLSGCTTIQKNVDVPPINIPAEIMASCEQYIIPNGPYFSDFIKNSLDNKKIYEDCVKLNEAKRKFIENLQK